jgi:hypothetical protein
MLVSSSARFIKSQAVRIIAIRSVRSRIFSATRKHASAFFCLLSKLGHGSTVSRMPATNLQRELTSLLGDPRPMIIGNQIFWSVILLPHRLSLSRASCHWHLPIQLSCPYHLGSSINFDLDHRRSRRTARKAVTHGAPGQRAFMVSLASSWL